MPWPGTQSDHLLIWVSVGIRDASRAVRRRFTDPLVVSMRVILDQQNRTRVKGTSRKLFRCAAIILFVMAAGIFCSNFLMAQIAPGPLSPAHAYLKGIADCTSCHDLFSSNLKCFECHTEIRRRVDAGAGFHARAYNKFVGTKDCTRCHAEHRGPGTPFVPLDRNSFDHGVRTGFVLEGKHREQTCENCHSATRIEPAARAEIKVKDLGRSFLGLRRDCTSCHLEPHQKQLGAACQLCHTPEGWRPASKFSHARTAFPLTGMHQQVPCEKCHSNANVIAAGGGYSPKVPREVSSARKTLLFKGLLFNGCNSCHQNPHGSTFQASTSGSKCERCHNTGGFRNSALVKSFDHGITKFPLIGKHAELTCGRCHKPGIALPAARQLCRGCHEDQHKGQFGGSRDCSACHSPVNFTPALFDRAGHARSVFPLAGKHATLACGKCHQPGMRKSTVKAGTHFCSECHAEPHGDEFAKEPYNNRCELCHAEAGADASPFTVDRHTQTAFPLTGRHAEVACKKCHSPLSLFAKAASSQAEPLMPAVTNETAGLRMRFHFASRACNGCHADPHGIDLAKLTCETCHTPEQWKAVRPFDHALVPFKLEGAHREAANAQACIKCHDKPAQAGGSSSGTAPVFSGISMQCAGCHAERDPHGGQFNDAGNGAKDCSACHAPVAWNAGTFDHGRTRFTLTGAHRGVNCVKCHKEQTGLNGKAVRLYRQTSVECLNCH